MPLGRTDTIAVAKGADLRSLPLTPEDFFVLSRITGKTTVAEAISASGLEAGEAEKIIERLHSLGVLERQSNGIRDRRMTPTGMPADPRPRADGVDRRRQRLAAQLKASGEAKTERPSRETPKQPPKPPEPEIRSILDFVVPVPEGDPRIDSTVSIDPEEQRRLLAIIDRIDRFSHYDILGIAPTNDTKLVRRAYHHASRKVHPDAFFGKELGFFRVVLDELFKRAKASYEILMDDSAREAYLERLTALRRRQEEVERQQQAGQQRVRDAEMREAEDRERLHRAREEAEGRALAEREALARETERRERATRDEKRRRRTAERLTGKDTRNAKAAEHVAQGRKEMEASRFGAAAALFRLAIDLDPNDDEAHQLWQECLSKARIRRAERAFEQGQRYAQRGQKAESAHFFAEAAEANPTARNLGEAAGSLAEVDPPRARDFAVSALDALGAARKMGVKLGDKQAAKIHLQCAQAFLAAGQHATAKTQAKLAVERNPDDKAAKALLNSIKVP